MFNAFSRPVVGAVAVFVAIAMNGCGGSTDDERLQCGGAACDTSGTGGDAGNGGSAGSSSGQAGTGGGEAGATGDGGSGGGGQAEPFANFPPYAYFDKGATFEYQLFPDDAQAEQRMAELGDDGWLTLGKFRGLEGVSHYLAARQHESSRVFDVKLLDLGNDPTAEGPVDLAGGWVPLQFVTLKGINGGHLTVRDRAEPGKYEGRISPFSGPATNPAQLSQLGLDGWALASLPDFAYHLARETAKPRTFVNESFSVYDDLPHGWLPVRDPWVQSNWFAVREVPPSGIYTNKMFVGRGELEAAGADGWLLLPGDKDQFLGVRAE
jgi:hypothetical protein